MSEMIKIEPAPEMTVHDKLSFAYEDINRVINRADGGRKCDGPSWAAMQDCRRQIREAMQMLRDGRKPV